MPPSPERPQEARIGSHIFKSRIVLQSGDGLAVLVENAPIAADQRIECAQQVLREYTGRADIIIGRRASGRPRLAPPYPELAVSLSHRGRNLLAAFSPMSDVGVDIEPDDPAIEVMRLAADHFSQAESAALATLPAVQSRDMFLRLWVAKEAALKLTGRGIFDGLGEPDLALDLEPLRVGDRTIAVPASSRLPALTISVCRILLPGQPANYCGLAVACH